MCSSILLHRWAEEKSGHPVHITHERFWLQGVSHLRQNQKQFWFVLKWVLCRLVHEPGKCGTVSSCMAVYDMRVWYVRQKPHS
mmetsp:Transcript_53443/g.87954  ORF Transcript_53443/g.87954 Transcript_53443/m.87954 type:complete len:83 (+) Transcript_53443:505-753(+)